LRVDADARNGFGFEGVFFKCGAWVNFAKLRPSAAYPELPVLLEYGVGAAIQHSGTPDLKRPSLYVLWRWKPEIHGFHEIGRASSFSWEWAEELRPLAVRALAEARGGAATPENAADLVAIARTITAFTDKRLGILEARDRARLLGILHDYFASRLSA